MLTRLLGVSTGLVLALVLSSGPVFANGTIEGTIRIAAPAPSAAARPVLKDTSVCGREAPNESVVVGKAGALANVVVSVTDARFAGTPPPVAGAALDQRAAATSRTCRR